MDSKKIPKRKQWKNAGDEMDARNSRRKIDGKWNFDTKIPALKLMENWRRKT